MQRERRREIRQGINLLVNKYVDGDPHLCRAVNLSRRGMLLYKVFEPDLPIGEVEIELQLPGDERVMRLHGITFAEHRWARAQGVRFDRISDEDAEAIDAYLADPHRVSAIG